MAASTDSLFSSRIARWGVELAERLRWVIGVRWAVAAALILVGVVGWLSPLITSLFGPGRLGPLSMGTHGSEISYVHIALAAVIVSYNLFYLLAIRSSSFGKTPASFVLSVVQIPIDLLVFTAIIHFSGGVTGPVFVLYFLYIFVGLAILPPVGAYLVAGLSIFFYGALSILEVSILKPPLSLPAVQVGGEGEIAPGSLATHAGYFLTVAAMLLIIAYIANYFAGLLTRGERTIREQLDELNSLYAFTNTSANSLSMHDVMNSLLAASIELEGADAGLLLLYSEQDEGEVVAARGFSPEELAQVQQQVASLSGSKVGFFLADGRGVYAPDVDSYSAGEEKVPLRSVLTRTATRSFYAVPMSAKERLLGTVNLNFDKPYTMPQGHWSLISAMAQQAALAMERMHLFADTQRAAREMTSLYYIGLATTSSLQIDEVLHLIYEQVNRALHPDTFYIALYDEDRRELRYDLFVEGGRELPPFRTRLDNVGISSWVIRNDKPVFIRHWDLEIEQLPFQANTVGMGTESVISVPLVAKNKIVGVMSAQAVLANAFDQTHLRLLMAIASQAALALENAKLHATVHEQAQRDPLTGAYNHGTLIDKLNVALGQAQLERQQVALIMLDIDHFKEYNDTYGHLVGDDVLRWTVAAIQRHLKSTDTVGRWGGEEFSIVLPGVTREQARLVAERIRRTVASNIMRDMHNRTIPAATVSQGIAFYPDDATDLAMLIDRADSALYRAKSMGRNRIHEWTDMAGDRDIVQLHVAGQ